MKKVKVMFENLLNQYIEFVAEPSESVVRNHSIFIVALAFTSLGIYFVQKPNNILLKLMQYDRPAEKLLLSIMLLYSGVYMLVYWLFLLNKISYGNGKKTQISSENTWIWLRFFFLLVLPIECGKKIIRYVLCISRQKETIQYITDFFIALLFTLIIFRILLPFEEIIVTTVSNKFDIRINDEIIALIMVTEVILLFSLISRLLIKTSICILVFDLQYNKLKRICKVNVLGTMKGAHLKKERSNEIKEVYAKVRSELLYTKLYFYILVNFMLLCSHFEENDTFGKMFANSFLGITTLTALGREIQSNMRLENK